MNGVGRKALVLFVVAAAIPLFGSTYYIAANGSDFNDGLTRSTPWLHAPGMPGCAAKCGFKQNGTKGYTAPGPGDRFIFRGGDLWGYDTMGMLWNWGGAPDAPIYIGVDENWFSGPKWNRPIFDCGLRDSSCGADVAKIFAQIDVRKPNVIIDAIEFKGLYVDSTTTHHVYSIFVAAGNVEVQRCYFHGWGHAPVNPQYAYPAAIDTYMGAGGAFVAGTKYHENIVDGSDTSMDLGAGFVMGGDSVYDNVIRYVVDGIIGSWNNIHGNLVEHTRANFRNPRLPGDPVHCDSILHYGPAYGKASRIYNNVVRHTDAPGCPAFWLGGLAGSDSSLTTYAFNNVLYDNAVASGSGIGGGGHPWAGKNCNYGSFFVYNNTIAADTQPCTGNGEASGAYCKGLPRAVTHYANNHCITTQPICISTGSTCIDDGGNLTQTPDRARKAGYRAEDTSPYSPNSTGAPTFAAGKNQASHIAEFGPAYAYDTSLAVEYDEINHRVIAPGRNPVLRPNRAWDSGAYQSPSSTATPVPARK